MAPRAFRLAAAAFALAAVTAAGGAAHAQSIEDRLRAQLVAVTGQLHQAQSAQSDLAGQKAAVEKERDALKAKLAAGGGARPRPAAPAGVSPAVLAAARAQASTAETAAAQAKTDLETAQAEAAKLRAETATLRAQGQTAATRADMGSKALAACQAKNAQALVVARDILDAYSHVSVADVIARKEPFTGLKRVQIERLEQGYADRIYDSRLDATTPAPAALATPASAASPPAAPPRR